MHNDFGFLISRGFVVALSLPAIAFLAGCGGEGSPADAPVTELKTADELEPTPDMPKPKPLPVGEQFYRDAMAEMSNQTGVEWVEEIDRKGEVSVAIVKAVYENDRMPVVEAAHRVHKNKGEPVTIYVVDSGVAKQGWKPGDDGLIDTIKLPLTMDLRGKSN